MLNSRINFETAKELKEKGYDTEDCDMIYSFDFEERFKPEVIYPMPRIIEGNSNIEEFECLAPKIYEVIDWLLDEHKLFLFVHPKKKDYMFTIIDKRQDNPVNLTWDDVELHGSILCGEGVSFKTIGEAYEKGIEYIIKNDLI